MTSEPIYIDCTKDADFPERTKIEFDDEGMWITGWYKPKDGEWTCWQSKGAFLSWAALRQCLGFIVDMVWAHTYPIANEEERDGSD